MPLPIAFWEVQNPHQVTFNHALPEGTEIPNREGVWAAPRMVRHTRFPMGPLLIPTLARRHILDAYEDDRSYYLMVPWLWDTYGQTPRVNTALFRCKSDEILQYGSPVAPEWFQGIDEVERQGAPTAWDRLMGDDEL